MFCCSKKICSHVSYFWFFTRVKYLELLYFYNLCEASIVTVSLKTFRDGNYETQEALGCFPFLEKDHKSVSCESEKCKNLLIISFYKLFG